MADSSAATTIEKESGKKEIEGSTATKKKRGLFSRIFTGLFTRDDFEKRLQYLSKEEASVMARMKNRSRGWRRIARNFIVLSVLLEIVAVGYAIMTTRSIDLNWKMRALRVLPMFALPALSTGLYFTIMSFIKMFDRRDQKTLERLREEKLAKINELKERTNYYTTQQLIQRYDPDPAAKAAAASVLASKLGAESGLKVYLGDESALNTPQGKSNDIEFSQSKGLRNRKQSHSRSSSTGNSVLSQAMEELPSDIGYTETQQSGPVIVNHHPSSTVPDSGWFARIAALLVGEDPTQSYALICGSCHMHNGLARKEDFAYITYYCPHCHALNKSQQLEEHPPISSSTSTASLPGSPENVDAPTEEKLLNSNLRPIEETVTNEDTISEEPLD